jgi:glycopeptide antibiotics resistance protein
VKSLSKTLLGLYSLLLLWLVLFKLSFDIPAVLGHGTRSLNLVSFAGYAGGRSEMITNLVVFIPLGLLLSINFKRTSFRRKLAFVFLLSVASEVVQYILAIGITDITDVITNTLGGFIGLALYSLTGKHVDNEKLDRFIVVAGTVLSLRLCYFVSSSSGYGISMHIKAQRKIPPYKRLRNSYA